MLWHATPWSASAPAGIPPLGSNHDEVDSVQVFQPFLQTTRRILPSVPLWNPAIMGGRPYLADAQSAVFSPLNLPGYVLPFWHSLAVMAALKLFVAAFGTYLLGRALGLRFGGALLAGTVFGFSLWMVSWVTWPTTAVWAYLPWLCLLADRLRRRPGPLPFAGLAVVVALQYFAGHPESSFHVLLCVVLFWLVRLAAARPAGLRAPAGAALLLGGALLAGTALAALTLLPFLEAVHHSIDLDARRFLGPSHGATRDLFGLFLHDYWGRQTRTSLVFPSALEESAYYVGALTLMLALAALVLRPNAERIALAVIGAVALAVATGVPPFFGLVKGLPGFSTAHNARLAVIFVFVVALLAGRGLDELTARSVPVRAGRLVLARGGAPARPAGRRDGGRRHARARAPGLGAPGRVGLRAAAELRGAPDRPQGDEPRRAPSLQADAADLRRRAAGLAARVAPSGRDRGGADRPAPAGPAGPERVRRAGRAARRRRPVQGRDGLHARDPDLPRRAARDAGDQLPAAPGRDAVRRPRRDRPGDAALPHAARTWPCATALDDARGYDYPVERRYYEFWQTYVSTAARLPVRLLRPVGRVDAGRAAGPRRPGRHRPPAEPPRPAAARARRPAGLRRARRPGLHEPARPPARLPRRAPDGRAGRARPRCAWSGPRRGRGDRWP